MWEILCFLFLFRRISSVNEQIETKQQYNTSICSSVVDREMIEKGSASGLHHQFKHNSVQMGVTHGMTSSMNVINPNSTHHDQAPFAKIKNTDYKREKQGSRIHTDSYCHEVPNIYDESPKETCIMHFQNTDACRNSSVMNINDKYSQSSSSTKNRTIPWIDTNIMDSTESSDHQSENSTVSYEPKNTDPSLKIIIEHGKSSENDHRKQKQLPISLEGHGMHGYQKQYDYKNPRVMGNQPYHQIEDFQNAQIQPKNHTDKFACLNDQVSIPERDKNVGMLERLESSDFGSHMLIASSVELEQKSLSEATPPIFEANHCLYQCSKSKRKKPSTSNDTITQFDSMHPTLSTCVPPELRLTDQEEFVLTLEAISRLHKIHLDKKLYLARHDEIADVSGNKLANVMGVEEYTPSPEKTIPSGQENMFFILCLCTPQRKLLKKHIVSAMIMPMVYQNSYQYNHNSKSTPGLITKRDGYFILHMMLIFRATTRTMDRVSRKYTVSELVFPADHEYTGFLKDVFLIRHCGQKLLITFGAILNGELRFRFHRITNSDEMDVWKSFSCILSDSTKFIEHTRRTHKRIRLFREIAGGGNSKCTTISDDNSLDRKSLISDKHSLNPYNRLFPDIFPVVNEVFTNLNPGGHIHPTHSTASVSTFSEQEMNLTYQEEVNMIFEAVHKFHVKAPFIGIHMLKLDENIDGFGRKSCILVKSEEKISFRMRTFPSLPGNMFFIFCLCNMQAVLREYSAISIMIMPMKHLGLYQYNRTSQGSPDSFIAKEGYYLINIILILRPTTRSLPRNSVPFTKVPKNVFVCELLFPADKEHVGFLKEIFLIRHCGQKLQAKFKDVQNDCLRYIIHKAEGNDNQLKAILWSSLTIPECQKFIEYQTRKFTRAELYKQISGGVNSKCTETSGSNLDDSQQPSISSNCSLDGPRSTTNT